MFKCSACDYYSPFKPNVKSHINKKIKCSSSSNVLTIITIISEIKCEYCENSYASKQNLIKHLKICKVKKDNLEKEIVQKDEKIKILEKEHNEYKIKNEETIKLLQKKLEETIKFSSKLIDKKFLEMLM
jgi:hypothetical protein